METQNEVKDSREFLEAFKVDVFPDAVYVFTPAGEVFELPKGSTPVDFAYRIHTDVGNRCVGGKVNGVMVPLRHELQSGDVVEIMTMANHMPSRDWLKFVKTTRAKSKIRQWIKQQERERSISLGREICEKELRKYKIGLAELTKGGGILEAMSKEGVKTPEDLFAAVGQGMVSVHQMINRYGAREAPENKAPDREQKVPGKRVVQRSGSGIRINGLDDIMVRFGKCCNPVQGDDIKGFITRGRGVTVHTANCSFLDWADPARIIDAQWDDDAVHVAAIPLEVICEDKKGLLADITSSISSMETNILNASVRTTPDKKAINVFHIEISGINQLDAVIGAIKKVKGVLKVTRLRG